MKYRLSVAIVVQREDKILVVSSRKWGGFSLPGGKLDPGETFDQAAKREFLEETGCEITSLASLGAIEHQPVDSDPNRDHWLCMCYTAEIGNQKPKQSEEGTVPRWASHQEVAEGILYRKLTAQIIARAGIDIQTKDKG
jgi:ADP-ribose pyrophosphatase YjhB (NUDIX family)